MLKLGLACPSLRCALLLLTFPIQERKLVICLQDAQYILVLQRFSLNQNICYLLWFCIPMLSIFFKIRTTSSSNQEKTQKLCIKLLN